VYASVPKPKGAVLALPGRDRYATKAEPWAAAGGLAQNLGQPFVLGRLPKHVSRHAAAEPESPKGGPLRKPLCHHRFESRLSRSGARHFFATISLKPSLAGICSASNFLSFAFSALGAGLPKSSCHRTCYASGRTFVR